MRRYAPVALVILFQVAILVAVPARQLRARFSGTSVTLRTVPADPYNILSGYYVTLSYEVERPPEKGQNLDFKDEEEVWINIRRDDPAWKLVSITRERPAVVSGQASIRATWRSAQPRSWAVIEGAQNFYIPEADRAAVEEALRSVKGQALVDLRVGKDGTPAIVGLRVGTMKLGY